MNCMYRVPMEFPSKIIQYSQLESKLPTWKSMEWTYICKGYLVVWSLRTLYYKYRVPMEFPSEPPCALALAKGNL